MKAETEKQVMKLHVLLWSPCQRAFHADTLARTLAENRRAMVGRTRNWHSDWITVGISEDRDDLVAMQQRLDPRR